MVTIFDIAKEVGLDKELVLKILWEKPYLRVPKATVDKVFETARRTGYDIRKLKIGKRMMLRKETLLDIINQINLHPNWTRGEILKYLDDAIKFVERVERRVFKEERITES
jgi:DNA-binding LacI/PurR family transcriptional regulator